MKVEHTVIAFGLMLILMASLPVWKVYAPVEGLAVLDLVLVAAFYLFLLKQGRKAFGKDFKRYFVFFSLWLFIIQFAVFFLLLSDPLVAGVEVFIVLVFALLALSLVTRFVFGKNQVEGKILLSDSDSAAVKLEFNLFAGINSGRYVVKAGKKYGKGEKVMVALKRKHLRKIPDRVVGRA